MLLELDDIGEDYKSLRSNVISCSTNKAERSRGENADTSGPMDISSVRHWRRIRRT